jgi:hypothetical protein
VCIAFDSSLGSYKSVLLIELLEGPSVLNSLSLGCKGLSVTARKKQIVFGFTFVH